MKNTITSGIGMLGRNGFPHLSYRIGHINELYIYKITNTSPGICITKYHIVNKCEGKLFYRWVISSVILSY